jgi:hypothetical protein
MTEPIISPPVVDQAPPKTATEARVALDARAADKDGWAKRFDAGGITEKREWEQLTAMIAGGGDDTVTVAMTGNPVYMPTTDLHQMAHTAGWFRELGIRDEVTSEFLRGEKVTVQEYEAVSNWKKIQMGNEEWVKKYLSGDVEARQKMMIANTVLVNGAKENKAA